MFGREFFFCVFLRCFRVFQRFLKCSKDFLSLFFVAEGFSGQFLCFFFPPGDFLGVW